MVGADGVIYRQIYGDSFDMPMFIGPLKELLSGQTTRAMTLENLCARPRSGPFCLRLRLKRRAIPLALQVPERPIEPACAWSRWPPTWARSLFIAWPAKGSPCNGSGMLTDAHTKSGEQDSKSG